MNNGSVDGAIQENFLGVEDGREGEGISRLTGADINAVAAVFNQLLSDLTPQSQAIIQKPCVRPLLYTPTTQNG